MISSSRAGLALAAAVSLLSASASTALPRIPGFGGGTPAAAVKLAPGEWAQTRSDLKADPATLYGALPNGMRYAIRKQSVPPGQAAFRLWIDAGSLMEDDDQQGLAHFLEHMAFNGSKTVPEGDMIKILERLGLAFGADTNASTGFAQTIYKLDLPRTDAETVDTSLMLLREAAGNLTIDQSAVDRERGVVLSEERSRDTPSYRIFTQRYNFLLPGQRVSQRYPIGKVDVLKSAPAARIADFYHRYYRPDRAVLVLVGDFDPAAMEARVKAGFSDWTAQGPAGAEPDRGKVRPRGDAAAKLVIEPGASASMQLTWIAPPELERDTAARRREVLVRQLGLQVLNRRFSQLSRSATPPFLGAGAGRGDIEESAEITNVIVGAEPALWREALTAVEQEQRRVVKYGVRQDELDREIEEYRASLKAAVAGAATRRPSELAGEIVGSLDEDEVVTSPADDLALFEAAVKGLKAQTVSKALEGAFKGEGPLLFMATPTPIQGGEATLLAALDASRKVAVAGPAAPSQVAWPYESFGTPGKVAEEREVADLDTVFVRFENGVRLTIKPTRFRDDEVLVRVNVGDGLLGLPADRPNPAWVAGAYIEGGLKQISAEDMDRVLAAKVYGARLTIGDDALVLSGGTRTDDLPTQLQVLAAYLAEPGWRPEAFLRQKNNAKTLHDQYEATDSGVLNRDLGGLMHRGDRRWTVPTRDEIAAARPADLEAALGTQLSGGPVEVVIVGDTTVEKAIDAVAATFGALPARPAPKPAPATARIVGFPDPVAEPVLRRHKGREDQAIAFVAWPTTDFYANPQRARDTAILGEVLKLRLLDELREAQGATYSPGVGYTHSLVWTGWGNVSANVEVPPDKVAGFFADVDKIAADLRATPPTADELARAKKPRLDLLEKARLTNQQWLSDLAGAQADPRRLDNIRQMIPGTERVTAADVQRAAQTFLLPDKAWRMVVRPN